MLVHICCSVDSHYFLERLKDDFPNEKLIGFFYDPNIHPYSEYRLRFLDVNRSCNELGIELIEGDYDFENWLDAVNGLHSEPEKGKRCEICFDNRLQESFRKAQELGEKSLTTSLLISPLKSQQQLLSIGEKLWKESGIEFIFRDYRSNGGVEKQGKRVKENRLYRQDYCGCLFALNMQRENQNRLIDEMFSPITNSTLPASIEERIDFFSNISKIDKKMDIGRENFLNYRLLKARVSIKKEVVPSYFIFYSHSERAKISGRIEKVVDEVGYLNRESVKILTLEKLNSLLKKSFKDILEIHLSFEEEIKIRNSIEKTPFSLSPIIILNSIFSEKIEIELESKIYFDNKEVLI